MESETSNGARTDRSIATAGTDGSVRVFDAESGAEKIVLAGHGVNGIDWDPASNRLATAGRRRHREGVARHEGGDRLLSTLSAHDTRSGVRGRGLFRRTAAAWPLE